MTPNPWTKHYPSEVSPELDKVPYANLPELIKAAVGTYSKTKAFTQVMPNGMNGSLTYAQIDTLSDNFASYLREVVGLKQGDRVAVQMPNCLAYPIVAFGVFKAGLVLVNTNPLYTAPEMIHQFSDSGAVTLVVSDMFADRLGAVLPKTKIKTVVTVKISEFFPPVVAGIIRIVQRYWSRTLPKITVEHTWFQDALKAGKTAKNESAANSYLNGITSDSVAALQYTGGTTGVSKGAMLSHGNLVTNTLQMISHCGTGMRKGKEVVLTALPMYHIFAFTVGMMMSMRSGGKLILIPNPRDFPAVLKELAKHKIHTFPAVNTLFNGLANHPDFSKVDWSHLLVSAGGGTAVQSAVAKLWFEKTGSAICEGYGLSETSPIATSNPVTATEYSGTIGVPVSSTWLKLLDDDGNEVPIGQAGEIAIKGPQVMAGYWQRPDETAKVMTADGYFKSGDVGIMDERGFFKIVDRKKDMILVSGFNVYPTELEDVVSQMPGVMECACVGVADAKSGEAVKLVIVKKDPALTEAQVRAYCKENMTGYKQPKVVEFRAELPKTPVGKILRRELRDK